MMPDQTSRRPESSNTAAKLVLRRLFDENAPELNDMALQRHTRPKLNAAAEAAGAAHDATTRNLIEQILADEEQHLSWLETEIDLYEKLGGALYSASRLQAGTTPAGP